MGVFQTDIQQHMSAALRKAQERSLIYRRYKVRAAAMVSLSGNKQTAIVQI